MPDDGGQERVANETGDDSNPPKAAARTENARISGVAWLSVANIDRIGAAGESAFTKVLMM